MVPQALFDLTDQTLSKRSHEPISSALLGITDHLGSLKNSLRLSLEAKTYQMVLAFGQPPRGSNLDPIKQLLLFKVVDRHRTYRSTEFRFRFSPVCDLEKVGLEIRNAYQALGYQCQLVSEI
jgi:hypothetical protein